MTTDRRRPAVDLRARQASSPLDRPKTVLLVPSSSPCFVSSIEASLDRRGQVFASEPDSLAMGRIRNVTPILPARLFGQFLALFGRSSSELSKL
jgi:hypothetical protein